MKRRVLSLTVILLAFPLMLKAEEISLTLEEAVAIALRDNRDILLKAEEVKLAKLKISEGQAALFPTLNFTGGWSRTRGLYPKDLNLVTTQTTLKQYLYQGGKTINTIKYNGYQFEVAQALLDQTKLESVLNIKKAFYTLALAEEFSNLNKSILDNAQEHLALVKERYQQGQASESDILNIQAGLSNVEQAYQASLHQAEASSALLNNLLYLAKETKIKAGTDFHYDPIEVAYDEAFLEAMKNRPEIRQYAAQINADKKAIEIAKAGNRPDIYASWDYYSRSRTSLSFSPGKGWQDYNIIGVTFSWPIFDGWETKAKVEQAIVDLKETQLRQEKTVNDIALELKNAYLALRDALAKIKSQEADILRYLDNLSTIKKKYADGLASSLDLDDVSLAYQISLFNRKQAVYDYLVAKAGFQKATGGAL